MFDIGNVYCREKDEKTFYYIAVQANTLVCYKGGKFCEFTTDGKFTFMKGTSVSKLCKHWGISAKELDEGMRKYFAPDIEARERTAGTKLSDLLDS